MLLTPPELDMPFCRIYHVHMIMAGCVAAIYRTMHRLILIFLLLTPALSLFAAGWDTQAAANAFHQARQKRAEIAQTANPTLDQYLACARIYRSVHVNDPHYGRTGDAIYEEGLVYQEAADRFSKPEYFRKAADKFRLLVRDYEGNLNCPDAWKRLGALYSKYLNDEASAEDAYRRLRSNYGYSEKAIQKLRAAAVPTTARISSAPEPASQTAKPTAAAALESSSIQPAAIQSIRFWSTADYTRVIVDLDSNAKYQTKRLSDPDRIYFDIANARLSPLLTSRSFAVQDELLKYVRIAQNRSDLVRVVLDISTTEGISISELQDPFRIVIDLRRKGATAPPPALTSPVISRRESQTPPAAVTELPSPAIRLPQKSEQAAPSQGKEIGPAVNPPPEPRQPLVVTEIIPPVPREVKPVPSPVLSDSAAAAKKKEPAMTASTIKAPLTPKAGAIPIPQQSAPTSRGDRTLTRTLGLKVGRIVIDPGHGGHDHGSSGPGGLLEKDFVLGLARNLKDMIEEKIGAEVVLTRDDDTFIPLEERTSIANQHKADLFISIHANSSRFHSISGVETYYLDFARTDAEREIAARENAMADNNVRDLEDLIKKIAKADKSTESRELASFVQRKLFSGARQVLPQTRNRGVRRAPFIVLIGANMPSVLAEVAFISNPKDERLLKKESTKQSLVKALFAGIDGYMKTLGSDVVQTQTIQSK
jgi:N-acetylmuramoyl-L-alanine amidase